MKAKAHVARCVSLVALTSLATHCQKDVAPPAPGTAASSAAPPIVTVPPPPPAQSAARPATPSEPLTAEATPGRWVESPAYKFKVSAIKRCEEPRQALPDAGPPPDRPVRVGVQVHVFSKYDELMVAPRDVTIEKDGVIIPSEVDPQPSAGCSPLLTPKTMRHEQVHSGVVVFQLPDESFARAGIVAYKPTRWGGAPRVEVKLSGTELALPHASGPKRRSP